MNYEDYIKASIDSDYETAIMNPEIPVVDAEALRAW
jgi:hypothetical protein